MLHLHVRLHMIHDVLPLLIHHLRLRMRSVCHHGHLAAMSDLRSVVLVWTAWIRSVCRWCVLLWLRMRRLMVHRNAHVSLVI